MSSRPSEQIMVEIEKLAEELAQYPIGVWASEDRQIQHTREFAKEKLYEFAMFILSVKNKKEAPMPPKPSDPVPLRPEPEFGQVWKRNGMLYFIYCDVPGTEWSRAVFEDGSQSDGYMHPEECVAESDVYVGKFAGFKVQEEGGK